MTRAKYQAKVTQDIEHQRQIGQALLLYADNNSGYFPVYTRVSTFRLFPNWSTIRPGWTPNVTISGELIIQLNPYIKSKAIFYCPVSDALDPGAKQYSYAFQSKQSPPFAWMGYYYFICEDWTGMANRKPVLISQAGNPNRILLQCIGGLSTGSGHGKGEAVYTFADGHCQLIHKYSYPYNAGECSSKPWKLLLPKWKY